MRNELPFFLWITTLFFVSACSKQTDGYTPEATVAQLYPLQVGKTFTYRLDSTVTANFGSVLATRSYLAKDTVESQFVDAQGRTSFRIFRYLTDTLAMREWTYTATYIATITNHSVEYVDQDLRFITLANPVSANTYWSGNSYLSVVNTPYYFFNNWTYQYVDLNKPFTTLKQTFNNCYSVLQINDQSSSVFDPNNVFFKTYSKEVYAKGVGLVYKEFLHINYQVIIQNGAISNRYYVDDNSDVTYGITLNLVDYK